MSEHDGHIELERTVDSIIVGRRHRQHPGEGIDSLMTSIKTLGLLQPVTVTPDGVLVCGARRLEAVKRLGWATLKVWVRSGISDELSLLLAQQDENEERKPLDPLEQAALFRELRRLMAEDAARRQAATRYGAKEDNGGMNGAAAAAAPHRGHGDSRRQAAEAVTGKASYTFLEQISAIERIAADRSMPTAVRRIAEAELTDIGNGADVKPAYERVVAAAEMTSADDTPISAGPLTDEELDALSSDAMDRVRQKRARGGPKRQKTKERSSRRSIRAFLLTWGDLDGWSRYYDPNEIGTQLKDSEWEMFERVLAETIAFADEARQARADPRPPSA